MERLGEVKEEVGLDYFFCVMGAGEPDYSDIIGKTVKGTVDRPIGKLYR